MFEHLEPRPVALLGKVKESLGGGALMEDTYYWGGP